MSNPYGSDSPSDRWEIWWKLAPDGGAIGTDRPNRFATPNRLAMLYGTVPSSNDSILSVVIAPKAMYSKNERGKLDAAVKYSETLGGERGEGEITIVN